MQAVFRFVNCQECRRRGSTALPPDIKNAACRPTFPPPAAGETPVAPHLNRETRVFVFAEERALRKSGGQNLVQERFGANFDNRLKSGGKIMPVAVEDR
jgi:hypothetical protein